MQNRVENFVLRKIITVLAGTMVSFPAIAQTSNVSLYGLLNIDMEMVSGRSGSGFDINRVTSWGGSQLGFRGTESLGGGVNVIFQVESGIAPDAGGTALASRPTFLGLQGSFGTLKLGRMFSAYGDLFPLFRDNTFRNPSLTSSTLWAQGGVSYQEGGFDDTLSNSVRYELPAWNGLKGAVQYTTAENETHGYNLAASLIYEKAGWQLGAGYSYNEAFRKDGENDWAATLVAGYNFGFMRLVGVYEHIEYEVDQGANKLKRDMYGAGVTIPVGKASLFGYYGYAADGKGSETARVGDIRGGDDTGTQQWTIAAGYPLSKRSWIYTGYMYLKNDARANYTYFRSGHRDGVFGPSIVELGVDQQSLVLGMVHMF